ncbi:sulfur carrier protein ThiS [Anaerotignum sp. MB30-C6]|uniref:sulfur carrier protein ThiS n=1 Tax=Anaerotignum sp. MB30-C6 TaxID=3070814 RepID=UPI0027DB5CE5|nr:sulfur carrier protein ThiS [Anaerotignum sp. MB30-C6]WMI80575.1 sulfur carrier protein ThiS [Anaerotignum sp. MB30-C6]
MRVNGVEIQLENTMSLSKFLLEQGYDLKRVAIERNGAIVPKGMISQILLSPEDTLEVVSFVGGG